jgi:hypothetical protein
VCPHPHWPTACPSRPDRGVLSDSIPSRARLADHRPPAAGRRIPSNRLPAHTRQKAGSAERGRPRQYLLARQSLLAAPMRSRFLSATCHLPVLSILVGLPACADKEVRTQTWVSPRSPPELQRDSERRSNPDIPDPGFITDRAGVTGADSGEAEPFASDRRPGCRANPRNTTSLSASATRSYMDRQSQFWIDPGLVLAFTLGVVDGRDSAAASARVLTPSLVNRLCT